MHISIHAPREGGDDGTPYIIHATIGISIHAPREGGDSHAAIVVVGTHISIHAPREGGDALIDQPLTRQADFNPRPPRGGRQQFRGLVLIV